MLKLAVCNLNFIANISILLPLDKKFKRYFTPRSYSDLCHAVKHYFPTGKDKPAVMHWLKQKTFNNL